MPFFKPIIFNFPLLWKPGGAGRALPAVGAAPGSIFGCPLSPRGSSLPQTLGPSLLKSVAERWFYPQKTIMPLVVLDT